MSEQLCRYTMTVVFALILGFLFGTWATSSLYARRIEAGFVVLDSKFYRVTPLVPQ